MGKKNELPQNSSLIIVRGHIPSEFTHWEGDPWLKVRPEETENPFWPFANDERSTKIARFATKVYMAEVIERKLWGGDNSRRATIHFLGSTEIGNKDFGLYGIFYPEGGGMVTWDPEPEFTAEGDLVRNPELVLASRNSALSTNSYQQVI